MEQCLLEAHGEYSVLDAWFSKNKCCMLVCGKSIKRQAIYSYIKELPERLGVKVIQFMDFAPNPMYESVVRGVEIFRRENCDSIMAVGGGSAMDVAKSIKLYTNLPDNGENGAWLGQETVGNRIPFLAMPTTSGTGSEATKYAVIYYDGKKQSISDDSLIPETVLMDATVLKTLPLYQKKATMMDALCHAIESYWSINSTEESKQYSKTAIQSILNNLDQYLSNTESGNAAMLNAAHIAGKAINITQTTAGHAMCYTITSLYGIAHGHAAALCDRALFSWMIEHVGQCIDVRGEKYLQDTLDEIGQAMGCADARTGAARFEEICSSLELSTPFATENEYEKLINSVNPVRLKNHPIMLDEEKIGTLYHRILR